ETEVGGSPTTHRWAAHEDRALALSVTSDGQQLVSGGRDGRLRVWTPERLTSQWHLYLDRGELDCALGTNDRLYVAGQSIHLWDIEKRVLVKSFAGVESSWESVDCSADGRYLVAVRPEQLVIISTETHEIVDEWRVGKPERPFRVTISSDGSMIALAEPAQSGGVSVYRRGQRQPQQFSAEQCECVAFSPDGHWLAAGHLDNLRLFNLQGEERVRELQAHRSTLAAVAFSPDGKTLATAGHDRFVKGWDLMTGTNLFAVVAHRDYAKSVSFTPNGRTIASAGDDGRIKLWHAATGQPVGALPAEFNNPKKVEFDKSGMRLVVRSEKIAVCDATPINIGLSQSREDDGHKEGAEFFTLGDLPGGRHKSQADHISADGTVVVGTVSTETGTKCFRWTREAGMQPLDSPSEPWGVRISDDGSRVVANMRIDNQHRIATWSLHDNGLDFFKLEKSRADWFRVNALGVDGRDFVGDHWTRGSRKWQAVVGTEDKFWSLPQPQGMRNSSAIACSDDGRVIYGNAWNGGGFGRADMRDNIVVGWQDRKLKPLIGLNDPRYNWMATNASADGRILIGVRWPVGSGNPWVERVAVRPYRWENGTVTSLDVEGGIFHDITPDGRIIVGEGFAGVFVWDQQSKPKLLKDALTDCGVNLQGWQLDSCDAVSADGTTFVGDASTPDGREEAYLIRIPGKLIKDQ
ncbi:MAG: hypothetical protein KDB23_22835, partial [Planctomycetales bacterium]|nr:hypothetical protein [Planctomycetales bacterium]